MLEHRHYFASYGTICPPLPPPNVIRVEATIFTSWQPKNVWRVLFFMHKYVFVAFRPGGALQTEFHFQVSFINKKIYNIYVYIIYIIHIYIGFEKSSIREDIFFRAQQVRM